MKISDVVEMKAICVECGNYSRVDHGISVWWDIDEDEPKDSVTFLCDKCGEATEHKIEVKWGE